MCIHVFVHYVFGKQNMSAITTATTATFAPQKIPTCICALCIQETEYVSHHSPFALRKVHVYCMYLCTMYSGNRICQPSQPFCTEECTYMYLCTMYSGNRICQPSQPFCTEESTCILYVFVHYVFGKQNISAIIALLHCRKYLHVFVHYVFRKQNMSATIAPFCFAKNICMYLCTM